MLHFIVTSPMIPAPFNPPQRFVSWYIPCARCGQPIKTRFLRLHWRMTDGYCGGLYSYNPLVAEWQTSFLARKHGKKTAPHFRQITRRLLDLALFNRCNNPLRDLDGVVKKIALPVITTGICTFFQKHSRHGGFISSMTIPDYSVN